MAPDQTERARDTADHARVLAVVGPVDREEEAALRGRGGGDREEVEASSHEAEEAVSLRRRLREGLFFLFYCAGL
jgi:hypothetical protein